MKTTDLALPDGVTEILEEEGIVELYPPQEKALPPALERKNLVLAVPTASGKSLVAYLTAIKHVKEEGGKVLYIVPLRALASEKYTDLKKFEPLGIRTVMSVGDFDTPDPHLEDFDIIVATSEKADSLLRHRSRWLDSISLVVADEVHLIHDPGRGPTLEVTLSKFRKFNPSLQVIALSATIKNSEDLANWLDAEHISSDWRPVPLKEGVLLDGWIKFTDNTTKKVPMEKDAVWSLVRDIVEEGGQCLVFVNTRRSTESLASRYAPRMGKLLGTVDFVPPEGLEEETSVGKKLRSCMKKGVAFHNAGLANEQRKAVEENFRRGLIKCIVATPTLAAGINLPARRVVVRDVYRYGGSMGHTAIPVLEVKQMCGRAGRPKYDSEGEAVLVAKNEREKDFMMENYLLNDTEEIYSKLGSEPVLRSHILATIATGTTSTHGELMDFLGSTFFAHQTDLYSLESAVDKVLDFLREEGMIREEERLKASFFGKRVSDLYIDPLSAVSLRDALLGLEEGHSELGLLHAVSSTPDMRTLYLRKSDYNWIEEELMERRDELILPPPEDLNEYDFYLSELKTALSIEHWIEETEEDRLLKKFHIGPGDLRNKVEIGEWLLYAMKELANIFNKQAYPVLTKLISRVKYGVKSELLELVSLDGVGRSRARSLYSRGYTDLEALKRADIRSIARAPMVGQVTAEKIKEQVGGPKYKDEWEEPEEEESEGQLKISDF